ncbi:MAG: hypothetical protein KUG78_19470 [Kangiellaceae bacterium]|nr:hypothetical protein [Kangiellaceae bacterium]
MIKLFSKKSLLAILVSCALTGCGDYPDYSYSQSDSYCMMSFPFAGGIIGRQYIGYFRVISTLQYMDADPEIRVIATGPSHIDLEPGSFQLLEIGDKSFKPEYKSRHLEAELQLYGPSFIFSDEESLEIYQFLRDGENLDIFGRIEVGHQYETSVYNFFFGSADEQLNHCVNRLLNKDDLKVLAAKKLENRGA